MLEPRGKNDSKRRTPGTAADDGEIFHDALFMTVLTTAGFAIA
jgi:hypothetical protein